MSFERWMTDEYTGDDGKTYVEKKARPEWLLQVAVFGAMIFSKEAREMVQAQDFTDPSMQGAAERMKGIHEGTFTLERIALELGVEWAEDDFVKLSEAMVKRLKLNGRLAKAMEWLQAQSEDMGAGSNRQKEDFLNRLMNARNALE